ncbi:Atp synthase f0 sector subunit c [Pleurostoma richardsiae]|uniref:Atp synthase f0 sector subunit c n=1 Tax=Pleurostoma richardsiae TaxID=41990 RepID=A0AA38RXX2_9PEZI|nr:Atp synthase f0 sector subunit c [Pleurostoma richardsiae]
MVRLSVLPLLASLAAAACVHRNVSLSGDSVRITWTQTSPGWLSQVQFKDSEGQWRNASSSPGGQYGLLSNHTTASQSTSLVQLGQLGTYSDFLPTNVTSGDGYVTTVNEVANGTFTATWWIDSSRSRNVVAVNTTWKPTVAGWYSIASPRLVSVADDELGWGIVPGYWSSNELESNRTYTYTYVQGVPVEPLVSVEASTTSLVSILSNNVTGAISAVIADPSLARDPYATSSISTQTQWNVAMSLRSRDGSLAPTAYYPVLGQAHSQVSAGGSVQATFLYVFSEEPDTWYEINRFVHEEVYPISEYGDRAEDLSSLRDRLNRIHDFVVTPASKWNTWTYDNLTMGAESGKLSDVAAMWMVQRLTGDPLMLAERLPYARNFKLGQQDTSGGVFDGAAVGEYYKSGKFVSELIWASVNSEDYVSPIFTTFYILSDVGNIILFNSTDELLLSRFTLAAEKLLSWQKADGSFDIGYIKANPDSIKYPYLTDNRATWYGFIAAYKILGDSKYLAAAEAGAKWFIGAVLETGRWLGVCDDAYLYPDFATAFAAQALLDLYELTDDSTYLDAAVTAAKFYTLHIFNHPVVDDSTKTRGSEILAAWQLSQVALNYEHAGYKGTAGERGPITISSHAGCFVRIYEATGDAFFLELARLAARGRDAFVDPSSGIPSYYWYQTNTAGSRYPWHGWWHIGWVTDYLLASAHALSGGEVDFPHGFITAKVGAHVPYGFASGTIYGEAADLWQPRSLLNVSDPEVDYITARSTDGAKLFVILLNELAAGKAVTLTMDPRSLVAFKRATWGETSSLAGSASPSEADNTWSVDIPSSGLAVFSVETTLETDPQGPAFRNFTVSGSPSALTVSWSFWTTVESWAQWAVPGSGVWTSLPSSTNYTFSTTIDLSDVDVDVVKIRVLSREGSFTGYSSSANWTVST